MSDAEGPASLQAMEGLNPEQRDAARHVDGPLLILAGAGSGKTRVITKRIAWLVQEQRVDPASILAVTFTNKAAAEMRDRCEALLGAQARRLWLSTFHAAGVRILRDHGERLGLSPRFVIYDDRDQRSVMRRLMKQLGYDEDAFSPREVLSHIDRAKGLGQGPDEFQLGSSSPGFTSVHDARGDRIRLLYVAYQEALQEAGAVDFGDLLRLPVQLLTEHPEVRERYHQRLQYLMVDEYQDTNAVQNELLRLLTAEHHNLVVVGDDDQSIYRWRGADRQNLLRFERSYPEAKVVRLEQNYRSTETVLRAAHAVIRHARGRKEKELWTKRGLGDPIEILACRDEQEEARWVAALAERLAEEFALEEIAVFYRVNAQSRPLEDALRTARLPYHIVRGRSFYERAEVKDLVSYLRLAVAPDSDADLLRVINTPRRGLGKKSLESLARVARDEGCSLYRALAVPRLQGLVSARAARGFEQFFQLLEELHAQVERDEAPHSVVETALERSGYADALRVADSDESLGRLENLQELVSAAASRADRGLSLIDFLDEMALTADADGQRHGDDGHKINLMTLHAAKGLEFDAVIIVGMEERTFPHARAFAGEDSGWDPEEMGEERRLCYVGFTRARKRLLLAWARTRFLMGQRQVRNPSRFLGDIPMELIEERCRPAREQQLQSQAPSGSQRGQAAWGFAQVPPRGSRGLGEQRSAHSAFGTSYRLSEEAEALATELMDPPPPQEGEVVIDYDFDQRSEDERGHRPARRGGEVQHRTFGRGLIVAVDGAGPKARLTVSFDDVGTKRVVARYLEIL